jgi:hypothetical protein
MALRPRILLLSLILLAALALVPAAFARGGKVGFDGGTAAERVQVTRALAASTFDWNLVPTRVTVHIAPNIASEAAPGEIWLDAGLLDTGRFSWGVVQHEYAHQVDFLVLTPDAREQVRQRLGGGAWCTEVPGLAHADYGCERFASTLAWAYWPSSDNCMRPLSAVDESAALTPAAFRTLLADVLRQPSLRSMNARR